MSTGVGLRIRKRRKSLMLSQEALANRMGLKSKSTICKVERGDDNLTADTIAKYADALSTTPAFLMGWIDDADADPSSAEVLLTEEVANRLDVVDTETLGKVKDIINTYKSDDIMTAFHFLDLFQSAPESVQRAIQMLLEGSQPES